MQPNCYKTLLDRLLSINVNGGMKLGLNNIITLSKALNDPHTFYRTIHVAGSNGKGSVTTKVAKGLQESGFRVGLYTSPHISCFRERIQIDGLMISEESVSKWLERIFKLIDEHSIPATFFEITTILALAYFAEQMIDIAVIETGIGGRLDATNIIRPILSIITSVSLEHTDILGQSIVAIAKEKAGIIKPSTPVVIGPKVPIETIRPIATAIHSPCICVEEEFNCYHDENNAIARKCLEYLKIEEKYIAAGLKAVPPCRTEKIQRLNKKEQKQTFVLDVAHNPDGLKKLFKSLEKQFNKKEFRLIIGLSSNKDIKGCLEVLKDYGLHFHLIQADSNRAACKEVLREGLINLGVSIDKISCEQGIYEIINNILNKTINDTITVICGSFFIMNEARKALQINDPQDPMNLNESHSNESHSSNNCQNSQTVSPSGPL